MGRLGFHFYGEYCVGCRACQIACKEKNRLNIGVLFRQVRDYETGEYPRPGYYHHSSTCNHCEDPACYAVCPGGSFYIADDLSVQQDEGLCIGCRSCQKACPYDVPQYLEDLEIVRKCNMCVDLTVKGGRPVCVDACPQHALEWGDLEGLKRKHSNAVADLPILPSSSQTKPSTIVTPRACSLDLDFRQKHL
jgi:anaerobic dimethyl sulfoxide reductase subunit B (iron-sulfur subunit)